MAMGTAGLKALSAEVNVTPMIDILLVLIIIFMFITPLAPKGEDALIPQPPPHPESNRVEPNTLVVQILFSPGDQRPQLKINQEEVSWAGLQDRLYSVLKIRAEKVVFVTADKDIEFEAVAQVIDIVHQAGADKVGLMAGSLASSH